MKNRHLIFSFIAIFIIPLLLLASLELGLRLGGYGYDSSVVKKSREDGRIVLRENPEYTRGVFMGKLGIRPQPFVFPAEKSSRAFRIFVLGESAAAGYPGFAFSFSRILEVMLRDQFPGVRFEVINTGLTSINSHAILQITKDLAPWQPDLFIVYMGNNEVVGPYGPGTIFSPLVSNIYFLRAIQFIKTTRTGQLLANVFASLTGQKEIRWEGMKMFLDKQVRADDVRLQKVYGHFERNIEDILRTAKNAGAQTIVCSLVSDVETLAPFASMHKPGLSEDDRAKWDELYASGMAHETAGDHQAAIQDFVAASRIDNDFADLHFRLGRCYSALSDHAAAKESFIRARDLDALRFRPDTRINEIIRSVAKQRESQGIYFFDAEEFFNRKGPHGIADDEYLMDHVHFNFDGNYLLAKEIFEKLQSHLPPRVLNARREGKALLTRQDCGDLLAYTGYNQYITEDIILFLMEGPPFTGMLNHEEVIARKREEERDLRYYRTPEGLAEAVAAHRNALMRNRGDPQIHLSLGKLLLALKEREALKHLRRADQLMPNDEPAMILEEIRQGR